MKFSPIVPCLKQLEFRPYMIETAYDYYMVPKVSLHQRGTIRSVMSALAIEILLKSFNVVSNGNVGKINETYEFNKKSLSKGEAAHDLIALMKALPLDLQQYLVSSDDIGILVSNADLFITSRYVYEKTAQINISDSLIKLAAKLICKIIYLYQQKGCIDPFIVNFDVDELYFSDVQKILKY
jgi:hypothetical protein